MMDVSAYEIIKKIYRIMTTGDPPTISDSEVAYVTGLLEALLTTYDSEIPEETPDLKRRFLDSFKRKPEA